MIKSIINILVSIGFLYLVQNSLHAQTGGAILYAGVQSFENSHINYTKPGKKHNGIHAGLKARFYDGNLLFSPGIMYTLLPIESNSSDYFDLNQANFHILKAHSNLGYRIRLLRWITIRIELGASINYFQKIEDNQFGINYESIEDLYFNYHALIGVDLSWIVLELSNEYGFTNAFRTEDDSKFKGIRLSIGFFF